MNDEDDYDLPEDTNSSPTPGQPTGSTNDSWVSDDDLQAAMAMDRQVFGHDLSPSASKRHATRIFEESAVGAAMSMVHLAKHGQNENVRFKAAQHILDRALGKPTEAGRTPEGAAGPLEQALDALAKNDMGPSPDS